MTGFHCFFLNSIPLILFRAGSQYEFSIYFLNCRDVKKQPCHLSKIRGPFFFPLTFLWRNLLIYKQLSRKEWCISHHLEIIPAKRLPEVTMEYLKMQEREVKQRKRWETAQWSVAWRQQITTTLQLLGKKDFASYIQGKAFDSIMALQAACSLHRKWRSREQMSLHRLPSFTI